MGWNEKRVRKDLSQPHRIGSPKVNDTASFSSGAKLKDYVNFQKDIVYESLMSWMCIYKIHKEK